MSQKRSHAQISSFFPSTGTSTLASNASSQDVEDTEVPEIFTSSTIHDRASKFAAIFSPSQTYVSEPRKLQTHASLIGADHRILAWCCAGDKLRKQQKLGPENGQGRGALRTYSDDDGEKWAGSKVENVLVECGIEQGVCVVGRWWGGKMLGPDRFLHIQNVARDAIRNYLQQRAGAEQGGAQTARGVAPSISGPIHSEAEDAVQKAKLVQILPERDQSIVILRGLLAEKQAILAAQEADKSSPAVESPSKPLPSPAKAPDYHSMSVAKLRGLEKARDATLKWILKQIESVEGKIEGGDGVKDGEKE